METNPGRDSKPPGNASVYQRLQAVFLRLPLHLLRFDGLCFEVHDQTLWISRSVEIECPHVPPRGPVELHEPELAPVRAVHVRAPLRTADHLLNLCRDRLAFGRSPCQTLLQLRRVERAHRYVQHLRELPLVLDPRQDLVNERPPRRRREARAGPAGRKTPPGPPPSPVRDPPLPAVARKAHQLRRRPGESERWPSERQDQR